MPLGPFGAGAAFFLGGVRVEPIDERDRVAVFVDGEFLFKSLAATSPHVL